jgi:RNA polymerase sigma-70 factor, ECF subfamily
MRTVRDGGMQRREDGWGDSTGHLGGGEAVEDTRSGPAFAHVLPGHLSAMLRTAAALVGPADAEDAAQEAILRAWQAWDTLRDPAVVRSWLLRITANVCRDWQRGRFGTHRALAQPLLNDDDALTIAALGADPGGSDHTGALDLRHAVNGLEPGLRAIVVLRYYTGLDATEIGDLLSLPPPTVRTRLRRALSLLRERLSANRLLSNPEKGG